MSMHEFEDLVEASVRTLARSTRHSRNELRALYWNLYEFEALWDTGFTQFRVLDLLMAAHYTYRFDLSEHPYYQRFADFFQGLNTFSFLNVHPKEKWNAEKNPVAGYCEPPYLYCDVNSPLWYHFVQQGVLTGEDALFVERQDPLDLASTVVEDAFIQQNFGLIAEWYTLLAPYLLSTFDEKDINKLMALPSLTHIKQRFYQTEAHNVQLCDYGFLRRPIPDEVDSALLSWWFQAL